MTTTPTTSGEDEEALPLGEYVLPPNVKILSDADFEKSFSDWREMMNAPSKEDDAAIREMVGLIIKSGSLPKDQTPALKAVVIEGKTVSETATLLELKASAVFFRVTSALGKIKRDGLFVSLSKSKAELPRDPTFVMPKTVLHHYVPQDREIEESTISRKDIWKKKKSKTNQSQKSASSLPLPEMNTPQTYKEWCKWMSISEPSLSLSDDDLQQEVNLIFDKAELQPGETAVMHLLMSGKSHAEVADMCDIPEFIVTDRIHSVLEKISALQDT